MLVVEVMQGKLDKAAANLELVQDLMDAILHKLKNDETGKKLVEEIRELEKQYRTERNRQPL